MRKGITYLGLDFHKDWIVVSLADAGLRDSQGEVREYGKIANTVRAMGRLAKKLADKGNELKFCYEAGPCGYGIQRHLNRGPLADPRALRVRVLGLPAPPPG